MSWAHCLQIILSLLKQLPHSYKVCLLKNEFGDVEVDSELARESSIEAVSEILSKALSIYRGSRREG